MGPAPERAPRSPGPPAGPPVRCHGCRHFLVFHEPERPYGCRAYDLRSRHLPSLEVQRISGSPCQLREARAPGR